ncbi:MAG: ABC transporter substrate-binding protein [Burkholderiales bacterium]
MPIATFNRRSFTLGAAAALAVPASRAQPARGSRRVALAVGGKAAFYYLPLCIAEQLGYFSAEGLEIVVQDFAGGSLARKALTDGAVDVCAGAYEHTIDLQSKKQMYQEFVLMGRAPQIAFGVSTRTMPHYETPADLIGKRIGVTAPGSSTGRVARLVLARAGIQASAVSFVGVGTSIGALNALRSGQIDAMSNVEPVITMAEQRGELRIVSDTRTLKGTIALFGGLMPAACLYASPDFLQRNPQATQGLANAIVRALKWLQTAGPSDIVKTVPESYLLGDRALYLAVLTKVRQAYSPDGMMDEDGSRTALRALAGQDPAIRPEEIELERTYTNQFALRAKERFRA